MPRPPRESGSPASRSQPFPLKRLVPTTLQTVPNAAHPTLSPSTRRRPRNPPMSTHRSSRDRLPAARMSTLSIDPVRHRDPTRGRSVSRSDSVRRATILTSVGEYQDGASAGRYPCGRQHRAHHRIFVVLAGDEHPGIEAGTSHDEWNDLVEALGQPSITRIRLLMNGELRHIHRQIVRMFYLHPGHLIARFSASLWWSPHPGEAEREDRTRLERRRVRSWRSTMNC